MHWKTTEWLALIFCCFCLLLRLFEPHTESWWWMTVLLYPPTVVYLLPTALLLLMGSLHSSRITLGLTLVALVLLWPLMFRLSFALPQPDLPGEPSLSLLSLNTHFGEASLQDLQQQVKKQQVQLLVLQEVHAARPELLKDLQAAFPGWTMVHSHEMVTLCRCKVLSWQAVPMPGLNRVFLVSEIKLPDLAPLQVVNVHLGTPIFSGNPLTLPDRLRQKNQTRKQQVDALLEVLARDPSHTLLVGDFNTPPRGGLYHRLARELTPVALAGSGFSYPAQFPLLHIDHVFYPAQHWRVLQSRTVKVQGTDHLGVLVTLQAH